MKRSLITLVVLAAFGLFMFDIDIEALQDTASAEMMVSIESQLSVTLGADEIPSQAQSVIFDTFDIDDPGSPVDPSATLMYAPLRSTGESWHYAAVDTTHSNWSITVDLTGAPETLTVDRFKSGFGGGYRWNPITEESEDVAGLDAEPVGDAYWKAFPDTRTTTDGVGTGSSAVKCYYSYQFDASGIATGDYEGGVLTVTVITM